MAGEEEEKASPVDPEVPEFLTKKKKVPTRQLADEIAEARYSDDPQEQAKQLSYFIDRTQELRKDLIDDLNDIKQRSIETPEAKELRDQTIPFLIDQIVQTKKIEAELQKHLQKTNQPDQAPAQPEATASHPLEKLYNEIKREPVAADPQARMEQLSNQIQRTQHLRSALTENLAKLNEASWDSPQDKAVKDQWVAFFQDQIQKTNQFDTILQKQLQQANPSENKSEEKSGGISQIIGEVTQRSAPIAKKATGKGIDLAEKGVAKLTEKGTEKVTDEAVNLGEKAAEKVGEKAVEEVSEKAVEEVGEKAVEEVGEKAVEEVGEKVIEQGAELAVEQGVEQVGETAGETALEEVVGSAIPCPISGTDIKQGLALTSLAAEYASTENEGKKADIKAKAYDQGKKAAFDATIDVGVTAIAGGGALLGGSAVIEDVVGAGMDAVGVPLDVCGVGEVLQVASIAPYAVSAVTYVADAVPGAAIFAGNLLKAANNTFDFTGMVDSKLVEGLVDTGADLMDDAKAGVGAAVKLGQEIPKGDLSGVKETMTEMAQRTSDTAFDATKTAANAANPVGWVSLKGTPGFLNPVDATLEEGKKITHRQIKDASAGDFQAAVAEESKAPGELASNLLKGEKGSGSLDASKLVGVAESAPGLLTGNTKGLQENVQQVFDTGEGEKGVRKAQGLEITALAGAGEKLAGKAVKTEGSVVTELQEGEKPGEMPKPEELNKKLTSLLSGKGGTEASEEIKSMLDPKEILKTVTPQAEKEKSEHKTQKDEKETTPQPPKPGIKAG